ncbi:hypothetical protein N0V93_002054 [Gnomoniopsis smithogilvyi]|uniref:Sushi domain-containing protein n=1 Tax=Gnomoniopsis smithogilvyi TaxID=1191159 RepID=A0A9W9D1T3_9PEZI|nr:hypothetical protein N0V93_002054 [Gnomoniopsis smithogilvyi]
MQLLPIINLLIVPCVASRYPLFQTRQNNSTRVPSRVEDGIQTECKTCPYSLCTNVAAYEYDQSLTLTCWTRGDSIVETNIWYETTDNCYVTEWDIIDGNYTGVLPYCGKIAETYTQGPSKTVYNTECNIIPEFVGETADHTKMYKPEVDLTLTCRTSEGEAVLDNTNWYKTLSNCYVPEAEIEFVDADLDNCGPIPFMEAKMRQPDAETDSTPNFARRSAASQNKRWLYLTQIGDDSAQCLAEPNSASKSRQTYTFAEYIVVQCATYSDNAADDDQIFLLTEDFCWVNDTLTDPQLIDSEERSERYPNCNLFTDTED